MDLVLCAPEDARILADLNRQLIEDERSDNTMTDDELAARMKGFLETDYRAYLFKEDNDVIGYALVDMSRAPLYLRQFLIVRQYRRRHIGKTAFEMLLRALDTDTIDLEVLSWNENGLRFWENCGFAERSRYMRYNRHKGE